MCTKRNICNTFDHEPELHCLSQTETHNKQETLVPHQGGWTQPQQQPQFPQQYALVPINGPGMPNGAHGPVVSLQSPQGFALQPGMPLPQMVSPHQFPGAINNLRCALVLLGVKG